MNAPAIIERLAPDRLVALHQAERKLLWLSAWMIHHANHVRPNRDGLKVGGHQASCASVISIMTAHTGASCGRRLSATAGRACGGGCRYSQ